MLAVFIFFLLNALHSCVDIGTLLDEHDTRTVEKEQLIVYLSGRGQIN